MGRYASYRDALCYISGRLLVVVDELRAGGRGVGEESSHSLLSSSRYFHR